MVKVAVPVAVLELGVGRSFALVRVTVNRVAAAGAVLSLLQARPARPSAAARTRATRERGMARTSFIPVGGKDREGYGTTRMVPCMPVPGAPCTLQK